MFAPASARRLNKKNPATLATAPRISIPEPGVPVKVAQPEPQTFYIGRNQWTLAPEPKPGHDHGFVDPGTRTIYPFAEGCTTAHLMFLAALAGCVHTRNEAERVEASAEIVDGHGNVEGAFVRIIDGNEAAVVRTGDLRPLLLDGMLTKGYSIGTVTLGSARAK